MTEPHWEHGYRGHGYWLGDNRLGYVGLGPLGLWDGVYRWLVEKNPLGTSRDTCVELAEGESPTLTKAKREVERLALAAHGHLWLGP